MSAHVLLNLLNELMKINKKRGLSTFYCFSSTSLMNSIIRSINARFYSSIYDIKTILKSHFW